MASYLCLQMGVAYKYISRATDFGVLTKIADLIYYFV